ISCGVCVKGADSHRITCSSIRNKHIARTELPFSIRKGSRDLRAVSHVASEGGRNRSVQVTLRPDKCLHELLAPAKHGNPSTSRQHLPRHFETDPGRGACYEKDFSGKLHPCHPQPHR